MVFQSTSWFYNLQDGDRSVITSWLVACAVEKCGHPSLFSIYFHPAGGRASSAQLMDSIVSEADLWCTTHDRIQKLQLLTDLSLLWSVHAYSSRARAFSCRSNCDRWWCFCFLRLPYSLVSRGSALYCGAIVSLPLKSSSMKNVRKYEWSRKICMSSLSLSLSLSLSHHIRLDSALCNPVKFGACKF